MENQRIYSLDLLKIVAIFGVIVFHTYPFAGINSELYRLFRNFWGFNVPVFFIISGYLFAMKLNNGDDISARFRKNVKRLIVILVAWSAVYMSIPLDHFDQGLGGAFLAGWHESLVALVHNPATILGEGVRPHLWFLIALITAMAIIYPLIKLKQFKGLIALAILFYILGLLTGAYAWSPFGISIGFDTRNGPFQSVLFVSIGVLLAMKNFKPSPRLAFLVFAGGFVFQMVEVALLYNLIPRDQITGGEYYLGTVPYAVGFVLLALSKPGAGKKLKVHKIAPYVLGVYMVQFLIITYVLTLPHGVYSIPWQLVYTPIVFLLSLLFAVILARVPLTRKLVLP